MSNTAFYGVGDRSTKDMRSLQLTKRVARQYGLIREGKGDISHLLELIGNGNLIVVPKPPELDSYSVEM